MSDMDNVFTEKINATGTPVLINTPECAIHKSEHENCLGCRGHEGCGKLVELNLLMLDSMMLMKNCTDLEQSLKNTRALSENMDKILKGESIYK